MQLRPDQVTFVSEIREQFRQGRRRVVAQAATGFGKTVCFSYMTQNASTKGNSVIVTAHRSEILDQISKALAQFNVPHGRIQSGYPMALHHKVQVASVGTLARRLDKIQQPTMVIVDECFPAGTLVGGRPIETIKVGDYVDGYDGDVPVMEQVVHCFKSRPTSMVKVITRLGNVIHCTSSHPILCNGQWVPAEKLTPGGALVSIIPHETVRHLPWASEKQAVRNSSVQVGVVETNNPKELCQAQRGDHAISEDQRNAPTGSPCDCIDQTASDGVETSDSWRERPWPYGARTVDSMRLGVGHQRGDSYGRPTGYLSSSLQNRRGIDGVENSHRGRWIFPHGFEKKGPRSEKEQFLGVDWVDRVEVLQPTSDGTFGGVCPDGFVYNLETTGTHTYTANDIVVHNCHHSAASQYVQIFAAWPKSFFLGFTATPERLDGRGLGEFYESMVHAPPVKWLVENDFLAKATYYAPPATVDTSAIRKTAGDFNRGDAEKLIDVPTITGNAVDHYRKLCNGSRAIAFCISIEHAKHVTEQFNLAGIPSECIDGTLSDDERAQRVVNLSRGKTMVMTSCELVSEGFDLPLVEAAILLRPTMSLSLHLQQLGRPARRKPAPNTCIILDHVGNCIRHGLMEDDRQWSLEGRPKRKASEKPIETQQCETCFAIFQGRECPQCGTEREIQKREIEVTDGQLVKLTEEQREAITRQRKTEERSCKTYEEFRKLGELRGYKNPAAWAHFRVKHSRRPDVVRSV